MSIPITRICIGQSELAVRLVQPGCDGGQLIDYKHVRLVISPPCCPNPIMKSPQCFCGCWPGYKTPWTDAHLYSQDLPSIVYPGFDTNEQGETVFRFDQKLWDLPPGRYQGSIELTDGTQLAVLDIDLCNAPVLIDRVARTDRGCR